MRQGFAIHEGVSRGGAQFLNGLFGWGDIAILQVMLLTL